MKLGTATLLLALAALAGCNRTNASILIEATCAPPSPTSTNGGCSWDVGTCSAEAIGLSYYDVYNHDALDPGPNTDGFFLGVQVDNQLTNNADPSTGQVNTQDAFVDTFTVDFWNDSGLDLPSITGPAQIQNTVPAGGSAVIGIYPIDVNTSVTLYNALSGTTGLVHVIATVKLHGTLGDGSGFVSEERKYPVYVCADCIPTLTCTTAGDIPECCPAMFQSPTNCACNAAP